MSAPSIVLAGGGSAGHVSPLLAIASAVRQQLPDARITAVGTVEGLETRLVPAAGFDLQLIDRVPFPRKPNAAAMRFPGRFRKSVKDSAAILRAVEADVVVGVGGYVCTPMYLAARKRRLPIVIHEANIRPGLANRVGARYTQSIGTAFNQTTMAHSQWVGMPMRSDIAALDRRTARAAARQRLGVAPEATLLVVTGGSLGAVRVNRAVSAAAPAFADAGVHVLHLTGAGKAVLAPDGEPLQTENYRQREYLDTMADAYAAADLLICRAGAGTVCEVAAVGVPAVFVPLPIGNGEQRHNAATLTDHGAGLQVADKDFTEDWIVSNVLPLLADPQRLATMSAAAHDLGKRDAAELMATMVLSQLAGPDQSVGPDQSAGE